MYGHDSVLDVSMPFARSCLALREVQCLLEVALPEMSKGHRYICKRAQKENIEYLRELHGPLCMQQRLVELPQLGKAKRCNALRDAVSDSGTAS